MNPLSILKTPGKTHTAKLSLMTPNFDINEKSNLETIVNQEKFQI
jgi:hypothetical protein